MHARILVLAFAISLSSMLSSSAAAEPTLIDVKKQISRKLGNIQTLQFKVKIVKGREFEVVGHQYTGRYETNGVVKLERRKKGMVSRYEQKTRMEDLEKGTPIPLENEFETVTITDEELTYHARRDKVIFEEGEFWGDWQHLKRERAVDVNLLDPKSRYPKEMYEAELRPDEVVDGKKVWVIEFKPKASPSDDDPVQIRVWFDQETGLELKNLETYKNEKTKETRTFSEFVINAKIDPKEFKFELPEGGNLVDLTGL
ncbi:MAG: hypothetical protein H6818_17450 [Phycisphaerales bacterium]|nr:hypothetical protein [Phycisphaerales bacterium]MCB9864585.1 hypothetical protein [Phycisphaerales bacterium]